MNKRTFIYIFVGLLVLLFLPIRHYTDTVSPNTAPTLKENVSDPTTTLQTNKEDVLKACANKIDAMLKYEIENNTEYQSKTIFIHMNSQLTMSQFSELNNMGVDIIKENWVPPVNGAPTGFYAATAPLSVMADLCNLSFIVKINYRGIPIEPQ
jgi:hypothetical protein